MRELRAISTRAAISRMSFSNHYEYGDLKANPRDLLMNYFDASLYFAHWLYAEVAFRFPKNAVDVRALRRYATAQSLEIKITGLHVVVAMSVEREDFDGPDDGASWLSSLIGLRGDIAGGDERPLYLAWLLGVQYGQVADEAVEPGRPDGLGRLSPSLASSSTSWDSTATWSPQRRKVARAYRWRWPRGISSTGSPASDPTSTWRCSRVWLAAMGAWAPRSHDGIGSSARPQPSCLPLRTASALRERAEKTSEARRQVARQREAQARARRERQEQAARDRYLAGLAKREPQTWQRIDALVATKRPRDYDAAVTLLSDLRDVSEQKGRAVQFVKRVSQLREAHATKPSLLARLKHAGF